MPRPVLSESVMIHMLADIDQIVTEMEMDYSYLDIMDWIAKLRHAIDGKDYKQ